MPDTNIDHDQDDFESQPSQLPGKREVEKGIERVKGHSKHKKQGEDHESQADKNEPDTKSFYKTPEKAGKAGVSSSKEGHHGNRQGQTAVSRPTPKNVTMGVMNKTPMGRVAGRLLSFIKNNKKGFVTGGGIMGTILGVFMILASFFAPFSTMLGLSNMLSDYNFGPGDRNIVRQARHIRTNIGDIRRGADRTTLSQRAGTINNVDGVQNIRDRNVSRANRRFQFRTRIARAAPSRVTWRGLLDRSSDPRNRAGNRLYGRGTDSVRSASELNNLQNVDQQEFERARDSRNPGSALRQVGRSAASNSIIVAAVGGACMLYTAADFLPSDEELYEMLLGQQSDFLSSGSQLAAGEGDRDEAADFVDSLTYEEPILEVPEELRGNLTAEEEADIERVNEEYQDLVNDDGEIDADLLNEADLSIGDVPLEEGEQTRSFAGSAAYKRMTNQEVTGYEPDSGIVFSAINDNLTSGFSGYALGFGDLIGSIPGAGLSCAVLTNPITGIVLTGVDAVTTVLACVKTAGVGCGARAAGFGAAEAIGRGMGWLLMQLAFNSLAPEGPEEMFGQTDMGANLAESENSRQQGAPPIDNDLRNAMRDDHMAQLAEEDRERGFAWRYISPHNHRSAMSQVALSSYPFQFRDFASLFTDFSTVFTSSFSRLLSPVWANEEEFNNYDIQQYGFSEEELDQESALENAEWVEERFRCAEAQSLPDDTCNDGIALEGVLMQYILDTCIDTDTLYYEFEDEHLCRTAELRDEDAEELVERIEESNIEQSATDIGFPNIRDLWVKVGIWNFNLEVLDSIMCLTEDAPCSEDGVSEEGEGGGASGSINVPSGTSQELAQQIIGSQNVTGDQRYMSQIQAYAEGDARCNIDEEILKVTAALAEIYSFSISSLNRYCTGVIVGSGVDSAHYRDGGGRAIDFDIINGVRIHNLPATGAEITRQFAEDAASVMPDGSGIGQSNCGLNLSLPAGISHFNDACNHLHIQVP